MSTVKKSVGILLALLMIIGVFTIAPVTANAQDEDGFEFQVLEDGTAKIVAYSGSAEELTIPDELYGYPVSVIGGMAFNNCGSLTSVIISDGIKEIDLLAFYNCTNLISITIPDSVININLSAFEGTAYYKDAANWEGDVLYIGKHLIKAKDRLSDSYKVKDGTICIAGHAFQSCKYLTDIEFPDSLKGIGRMAFEDCRELTNIEIPDSVVFLGDSAFLDCVKLESATISKNITSISYMIFGYCENLQSFTIPDQVTNIEDCAFCYCEKLTSITIPDGVTSIGRMAFFYCKKLDAIEIPDSVTSMGADVFAFTAYFKNASNWEKNVLYIGKHLIKAKNTVTDAYEIKEGTRSIAPYAFDRCRKVTSITIPDSITSIEEGTFYNCSKLRNIIIPDSVTKVGDAAFYGCKALTGILIPAGVTSIGENAFGFYLSNNTDTKVKYFRIYGINGSAAKTYADDCAFDFVDASELPSSLKISKAKVSGVKTLTYNGKAQKQSVTVKVGSFTLNYGMDYAVSYMNNKDVGTASLTITGSGIFTGSKTVTFKINKAANPMTVKTKSITAKSNSNTSFAKTKAFTIRKAQGTVTFKKSSGDKKITISKSGKITVKKGLKTGKTYNFKVKVTAAGDNNYKSGSKTVTVKLKVK